MQTKRIFQLLLTVCCLSALLLVIWFAKDIFPNTLYARLYPILPFQGKTHSAEPKIYKTKDGAYTDNETVTNAKEIKPAALNRFSAPQVSTSHSIKHSASKVLDPIEAMRQENVKNATIIQEAKAAQMDRVINE